MVQIDAYVQAFHDLGPRVGPILGVNGHMAEGGGTTGFLSRRNPDGVAVHFVVEYSGRKVQMLPLSHMGAAIRIRNTDGSYAIRHTTDPAPGIFGYATARAVLGAWADAPIGADGKRHGGPNHATVQVEVEGYALKGGLTGAGGPNSAQIDSLEELYADLRDEVETLRGNTGHRDHNIKTCPGPHFPWERLGGHGLYVPGGSDVAVRPLRYPGGGRYGQVTVAPGTTVYKIDGDEAVKADGSVGSGGWGASAIHDVPDGKPGFSYTSDATGAWLWVPAGPGVTMDTPSIDQQLDGAFNDGVDALAAAGPTVKR